MSNLISDLNRMEHAYNINIVKVEKSLNKIGVSIVDDSGYYRPFLEVLTDVKEAWDKLSNNKVEVNVIKTSITQSIVGIRDSSTLISILEN